MEGGEGIISPTISGKNQRVTRKMCNCRTRGVKDSSRQPASGDSSGPRETIVGNSSHIKLSHASFRTPHRFDRFIPNVPGSIFETSKGPFVILNILLCSHTHPVASEDTPAMIYIGNYEIAQKRQPHNYSSLKNCPAEDLKCLSAPYQY